MQPADYFRRRWRGAVPLAELLWRDLLALGTFVNLASSFVALAMAASGVPLAWAAAVHFAPLPFNLFLFFAVWRSPARGVGVSLVALGWLALMTFL